MASCIVGVRLFLGRHFTMLVTYTRSRVIPIDHNALSKSFPEGPTKGSPFSSSTPPGPSPTIISGDFSDPEDNTGPCPPSVRK